MTEDWSVSEMDVLDSIRDLLAADRRAVVATVVGVEGSAYRRPGAKMVVEDGGEGLGHITAGCLEDEVFELARGVLAAGEPRIETYDLTNDEDDVWGMGIGCNGVIDVLLEPLDESFRPAVDARDAGEPVGLLTVLGGDLPLGTRANLRDGEVRGEFPSWLRDAVAEQAAALVASGESDAIRIETDEGTAEVFVDGIQSPPELVVFGSGHDVGPVVELGKKNDFRVRVVSFRGATDLERRFPGADEVTETSPASIGDLGFDERTHAVVMTHNFVDDRLAVDELVRTPVSYVGLMGPRERFDEMLEEFDAEGRSFTDEELSRVYTPIGLDLGAGSPYGIATSIVSEVMAVHNGRDPKHLKERERPIHDRPEVPGPSD